MRDSRGGLILCAGALTGLVSAPQLLGNYTCAVLKRDVNWTHARSACASL
jgi:hypothetical protein